MAVEYCPRCGAQRVGALRFCRSCQYDFDAAVDAKLPLGPVIAAPRPDTPATSEPGIEMAIAAGVAWVICAALTGYLALEQLNASQALSRLGISAGDLGTDAIWNGFSAIVTVYFGARLLMRDRGLFIGSMIWALVSVGSGAYQIANGVSDGTFVLSVVAAGVAGVLSLAGTLTMPPGAGRPASKPPATVLVIPPVAPPPMVPSAPVVRAPIPAVAEPAATDRTGPNWMLIGSGMVLAAIVLAIGVVLATRQPSSSAPTPTPPAVAPPTQAVARATITPTPVQHVEFGSAVEANGNPVDLGTSFRAGKTIYWETAPYEPAGTEHLRLLRDGAVITDSPTSTGSGVQQTGTISSPPAGSYEFQITESGVLYADGTFTVK